MDEDDEVKRPTSHEIGMELDAMSVEELSQRIALLEAEMARLKEAMAAKTAHRSEAEGFFKS